MLGYEKIKNILHKEKKKDIFTEGLEQLRRINKKHEPNEVRMASTGHSFSKENILALVDYGIKNKSVVLNWILAIVILFMVILDSPNKQPIVISNLPSESINEAVISTTSDSQTIEIDSQEKALVIESRKEDIANDIEALSKQYEMDSSLVEEIETQPHDIQSPTIHTHKIIIRKPIEEYNEEDGASVTEDEVSNNSENDKSTEVSYKPAVETVSKLKASFIASLSNIIDGEIDLLPDLDFTVKDKNSTNKE